MLSYLRRNYFFFKSAKLFTKIKPHIYGFCFLDKFKKQTLLTKRFKRFFTQPRKYKKTKYFKYDHYYWSRGAEGYKLKIRISHLMLVRFTGTALVSSRTHRPLKSGLGNYRDLWLTSANTPTTESETIF